MTDRFSKKELWLAVLKALLGALLVCGGMTIMLRLRYPTSEISDLKAMTLSDCVLSDDGHQLTMTGDDPFMVFPAQEHPVLSLRADVSEVQSQGGAPFLFQLFYYVDYPQEKNSVYVFAREGENFLATEVRKAYRNLRLDTGYHTGEKIHIDSIILNAHKLPLELCITALAFCAFLCVFLAQRIIVQGTRVGVLTFLVLLCALACVLVEKYPTLSYLPIIATFFAIVCILLFLTVYAAQKASRKADRIWLGVVLLSAFALYFFFICKTYFGSGPDEWMRYQVVSYIAKHGTIPRGDDPEVRNDIWGASYAFQPLLPYLISGYLCRFARLFTENNTVMHLFARLVSAFSSLGTIVVSDRIASRLFSGAKRYVLPLATAFFPSFVFISTYVSTEAFAFFATALVIYYWVAGIQEGWRMQELVGLSVSMALVLLSYKNCYGVVLFSVPLCFLTIQNGRRSKADIAKAAGLVILLTVCLAGWWFIRNAILYEGDFLGSAAWDRAQALYGSLALEEQYALVPINRGLSVRAMLTEMEWVHLSFRSFISGNMPSASIPRRGQYLCYVFFFFLCLVGLAFRVILVFVDRKMRTQKNKIVFYTCLALTALFPVFTSLYYSYTSDFQPQGRYFLPGFTAFLLLCEVGLSALGSVSAKFIGKFEKTKRADTQVLSAYVMISVFLLMDVWFFADASYAYFCYYL